MTPNDPKEILNTNLNEDSSAPAETPVAEVSDEQMEDVAGGVSRMVITILPPP